MERECTEERAAELLMEVIYQLVEETRREASMTRGSGPGTVPKLTKLKEGDDVEAESVVIYFATLTNWEGTEDIFGDGS